MIVNEEIERMKRELHEFLMQNVVGVEPISFEMYQRLANQVWGCDPEEVVSVYQNVGEEYDLLHFNIYLHRPVEFIVVDMEIKWPEPN